jgi:hypothetical protein
VVIIGFGQHDLDRKKLFDYDLDPENPTVSDVANISPYLSEGSDLFIKKRQKPLSNIPETRCGNKPTDDGNFILTDEEKTLFLEKEPGAEKYLRRFTGSAEFINGNMRWCLWLVDIAPNELQELRKVLERVQRVKAFREKSSAEPTRKAAQTPTLFFYISQPKTDYILIPEVSSERRKYIPIGLVSKDVISANTNFLVPEPNLFLFGVITSAMHMSWVRHVGGRLKSDYRYSGSMVYNTFPWPDASAGKQSAVEAGAQAVQDAREKFAGATLADLYDPLTMPPALVKAHADLDRAVDLCYRPQPFQNDRQRVEHLFMLYERLSAPLIPVAKKRRGKA